MQLIFRNIEAHKVLEIKNKLNGLAYATKVILPESVVFFHAQDESKEERKQIREQLLAFQAPLFILSKSPKVAKLAWKINAAYFVDIDAHDWKNDLKSGFDKFLINNAHLFVQKIEIPSLQSRDYINPNTITYIKGSGNYSEIYFDDHSKLVVSKKLKELESYFISMEFIERFGKSIILNLNMIKTIKGKQIQFSNGAILEFPKYNKQFPYLIKRLMWETAKINYEETPE
ncbi:LytTR family transcriptional regulator DNA-binding domain-containing protein [Flavobacterium sp.]|uniref:LytTR family transcriptional regulator DNA-binding domain-containing protein n=1 Tax=Flavobacterium sp. TaxID=239 RepID=UPI003B9CC257